MYIANPTRSSHLEKLFSTYPTTWKSKRYSTKINNMFFCVLLFFVWFFVLLFLETGAHCVALAGLELTT